MRLMTPADRRNSEEGRRLRRNRKAGSTRWTCSRGRLWLGLAAGLLEVGMRVLCRAIDPTQRIYVTSRHFVWLTPLANMLLFVSTGISFWREPPRFGLGWAAG